MARMYVVGLVGAAVCAVACGQREPAVHPVVRMAPFDLNCPREQVRYFQLDDETWGVRGCGRQAKYVKICRTTSTMWGPGFDSEECRWVQN
jgi:hypothetical protein